MRGDDAGSPAALDLLTEHLPNLWEVGKQYASLEEMRYDLHRFFSLRSPAGQASAALYRLSKWADAAKTTGTPKSVEAKVYVDIADSGLTELVRSELRRRLGTAEIQVDRSLHAGTQCCESLPSLHYTEPGYTFHQGAPAFQEDLVIPWKGTRLINAVKAALPKLRPGEPVKLVARVSESPEQRQKLERQLAQMLSAAGAKSSRVEVLCAYKPGVSWVMDESRPNSKANP